MISFFKKNIKVLLSALAFAASVIINIVLSVRFDSKEASVLVCFTLVSAVTFGSFLVLSHFAKIKLHVLTLIAVLLLGCTYMAVYTPHAVPDEQVHYHSAYYYSNVLTFNGDANKADGGIMMRKGDSLFQNSFFTKVGIDDYMRLNEHKAVFCKENEMVDTLNSGITSKPLSYLPAGFGIALARLLRLSPLITYYMGRFFNLLFAAIMLMFTVKLMPFAKQVVFCIALLPMSLHLFASYSYDVYNIVTVLFMFAYIMRLIYAQKQSIGIKELLILAALIFFAVPYKVVYIFVAALVLLIPKDNFKNSKYHLTFKVALGLFALVSIFATQFAYVGNLTNTESSLLGEPGYTLGDLLSSPRHTLAMFYYTLVVNGYYYVVTMLGGSLSWFLIDCPKFTLIPFAAILLFSFLRKKEEPTALDCKARIYSAVMFMGVVLSTMFLLFIDFTPKSAPIILGVQGRYFIPGLPALFLALRGKNLVVKEYCEKNLLRLLVFVNYLYLSMQMTVIL